MIYCDVFAVVVSENVCIELNYSKWYFCQLQLKIAWLNGDLDNNY